MPSLNLDTFRARYPLIRVGIDMTNEGEERPFVVRDVPRGLIIDLTRDTPPSPSPFRPWASNFEYLAAELEEDVIDLTQ